MIGQQELLQRIYSYGNLNNLPNSLLFLGEYGCGKHTLVKEISSYYQLPIIDMTNDISLESIEQVYLNSIPTIYLINMDEVVERQQNMLLKFIEEPLKNSFIVLLSSNKENLLETITNRCTSFTFAQYTKEELQTFLKEECDESIFELCTTPGQILSLNTKTLQEGLHTLCQTIVEKLNKAKYSNALSITKKINYKDEYDKYDLYIFLKCLKMHLFNNFLLNNSKLSFEMYNIVVEEIKLLKIVNINKEYFMEHLITRLWERADSEIK